MDSTTIINLVIFIFLIALTTVFVGSEFALVKVRATKIEEMIAEGNGSAKVVKKMITNLDYYLSACQLGITVTSLGLGWLGEPVFEKLLHPLFVLLPLPDALNATISLIVSFLVVTYLHVVIGELAPKSFAIQHTERVALLYARPLYYFGLIMKPLIWLMNGSARMIIRIFGIDPDENNDAMSEEEIKMIINNSYNSGEINQTELAYMQNIFSFDERQAKDVMVPRTQMATLNEPFTVNELLETIREYQFTRYPITEDGDKDHIKGFINVKEFLTEYASGKPIKISNYIHELPLISETTRISDALIRMQRERVHISLIIDEYGGTAGILTMEDILEEIVGEIRDEFDENEVNDVVKLGENTYQINGRVLLEDLTDEFGIEFEDSDDIDTIGGWLQAHNTNLQQNDYVDTFYDRWIISEVDNHQIITVILKYEYNEERKEEIEEDSDDDKNHKDKHHKDKKEKKDKKDRKDKED
ncbi:transporter associated domain protein [Staphylococcus carnosus]|uniref:hemolysin family protein n=1 Tax=Staphylococcus carnosus TaxID=1281 RepID=UPI0006ABE8C0|nr:hemolysin family protein [Staphylococcus carnosus]ANZ34018.1 transporter associated domain protein [Staphylococcus carnosus]KOR14204.1 transporter associated domain protein [Staphylococcus carnosus]UTB81380.1 transporter associated domain protein [Staphylococcus carnosus]UTB86200.1 transporter associated domain protein [Staphylococcus carnosus]